MVGVTVAVPLGEEETGEAAGELVFEAEAVVAEPPHATAATHSRRKSAAMGGQGLHRSTCGGETKSGQMREDGEDGGPTAPVGWRPGVMRPLPELQMWGGTERGA